MSEELKPCPFCGTDIILEGSLSDGEWYICDYCGAESGGDGVNGWNTRPIEDTLRAENERLREALQKIKNWCCVDPDGGVETTISEMVEQALKGGI